MKKSLVILAAGMGSRFGGLKQIEPVGPSGEIIADYSIYDAIRCGFTKVVFVIKKENLEYFKENITKKFENQIEVEFAFQSLDDYKLNKDRVKMLGTAHALYCAKPYINEAFVMINSDDYYGLEAFKIAAHFIDNSTNPYEYLTINYPYENTRSKMGKVNRGLVKTLNNHVYDIEEVSIEEKDNNIIATSKLTKEQVLIAPDAPVAMNFFVFKPTIFDFVEKDLIAFLDSNPAIDQELILTDVIKKCLKEEKINFLAITNYGKWFGMTYKNDLLDLKATLNELIAQGMYPNNLWGNKYGR